MDHIRYFSSFLEDSQLIVSEEKKQYGVDRTGHYSPAPSYVILPKTTEEVSKILTYCNTHGIAVVPSAGRTGLSGAATALNNEIVLSVEKMNRISEVDTIGFTVEVGAGAILENIQQKVDEAGLYFPLDFAAKGSCMTAGFISTNAGGVNVLKYGMTRNQVLGIEVVLANGDILNLNKALVKDNSGYDLKHFFIGAEGTLGVITKATLKCVQKPKGKCLVLMSLNTFSNVPLVLSKLKKKNLDILAFEYLDHFCVRSTLEAMPQITYPFDDISPHVVLTEINTDEHEHIETILEQLFNEQLIQDATVAENSSQYAMYWNLRESVSDCIYLKGNVHANDVSVPVSELTLFLNDLEHMLKRNYTMFSVGIFGHIGDGNLHIYIIDENETQHSQSATFKNLDEKMFELIKKYNGSISAEHGIGLLKKDALLQNKTSLELSLMNSLKDTFDPNGILNPGKII